MKVLAYVLYGSRAEYELELTLSILSALRHLGPVNKDVIISVVTDRHTFMPGFPIELITVPTAEILSWQATDHGPFNHRAKPFALLRALERYQAPTVLLDTDTYFLQDPRKLFDRISDDKSLMHASDLYTVAENPLVRPIAETYPHGANLFGILINPQSEMLNSGVVGVTPANRNLIERSIQVTDALYAIAPVFTIEQLSFGLVLRTFTELSFCKDVVLHYWGVGYRKPFVHLTVKRFLKEQQGKPWEEIVELSSHLFPSFPKSHRLDVALAKLRGKVHRWDGSYQFAYLAYRTALTLSWRDPEMANVWAATALLCLGHSLEAHRRKDPDSPIGVQRLQRDFSRFAFANLDRLPWLHAHNKTAWRRHWA